MKVLNAFAASLIYSLLPSLTFAKAPWRFFDSQTPIKAENIPVDGHNPLVYCADPSAHLLQIDAVDLYPNPPKPYVQASHYLKKKKKKKNSADPICIAPFLIMF